MTKDMPWNLFSKDPSERSLSVEPQEGYSPNTIICNYNQISCESINYANIAYEIL
jgi:hypothetical protein